MTPTETAPPPDALDVDAGVIEEARARQRRHWTGAAAVLAAAVLVGIVLVVTGGAGRSGVGRVLPTFGSLKLTFVHGRAYVGGQALQVGIAPDLSAGHVALDIIESPCCGGYPLAPYPTAGDPLVGGQAEHLSPRGVNGPRGDWSVRPFYARSDDLRAVTSLAVVTSLASGIKCNVRLGFSGSTTVPSGHPRWPLAR
jgi:hypothetical protein